MTEDIAEAIKEMGYWNEAALLDRIVVWDRWIEKGIAPDGTKEARDAATQIIIDRTNWLRAERDAAVVELQVHIDGANALERECDRMKQALREIEEPPSELFDSEDGWDICAWMSNRAEDALKGENHD
jgi:hypothetical protein